MRLNRTLAAASLLLVAVAPCAAADTYQIDGGHSQIGFKIRHIFTMVPGRFSKFGGTIEIDPANLAATKVQVEIETASIDTFHPDRDKHLQSADFFDAAANPTITFASTEVVPNGKDKATMKGNLTMHGVTKPVEIEVDVMGFGSDPWGNSRAGFEGRTTINRKDFNIVWNKVLDASGTLLGDDVEITLDIEAVKKK